MQGLLNLFDIYGERFLVAGVSLLSLTFVTLMFLWSYNRRRFMAYKHHIPARVMQGYLDSIIQNSSALKSSLLRGGGVGTENIPINPAVFGAAGNFSQQAELDDDAEASPAELAQKNAEIASFKSQISEKDNMIADLEEKMTEMLAKLRAAEEHQTAEPKAAAPVVVGDEAMQLQLSEVTKERDLLKEKLKEYEFIENDLAEIPRLQRTVETYKSTLKQLGVNPDDALAGKVAQPAAAAASSTAKPAAPTPEAAKPVASQAPAPSSMDSAMASIENAEKISDKPAAAAPTTTAAPASGEKKGDDDLLQQFEKMLG